MTNHSRKLFVFVLSWASLFLLSWLMIMRLVIQDGSTIFFWAFFAICAVVTSVETPNVSKPTIRRL